MSPDEELCDCGRPGCRKTLREAEEEYRQGVIISVCALNWPSLYRLHRIIKKLQKKYPSFEDAAVDPRAQKWWREYEDAYAHVQMQVDEALWDIEEHKKKYGRYAGMEKGSYKDVATKGA
jgi:hypothetical protein